MAKVLIIGSGGREHALGWKLSQSDEVTEVVYSPGNGGTAKEEKGRNIPLDCSKPENFPVLEDLIKKEKIDLVLVGPEAPLSNGIVDYLQSKKLKNVFGPTKQAAMLETDKFFSYDLMAGLRIPQASSIRCSSIDSAKKAIPLLANEHGVVLKAKGLTAGKGVLVCDSAKDALDKIAGHIVQYGSDVLVAERLVGEEFSIFGISDGTQVYPVLIPFQDHKRLLDDDQGPNTGGMGAYGPAPVASDIVVKYVADKIMTPVVQEMASRKTPYKGFLYAGMIMTSDGPKVLEFNARFGDPECQPAMRLIKSDLYSILYLALKGMLGDFNIEYDPGAACCVVVASKGYPGEYKTGLKIEGLDWIKQNCYSSVKVFHAGTKIEKVDGKEVIVTDGGRVLGVTGYGRDVREAMAAAYYGLPAIRFLDKQKEINTLHYRLDIGDKGVKAMQQTMRRPNIIYGTKI